MIVTRQTPSNCHVWFMNGQVTHFWPMRNKDKPAKRLRERNLPQVETVSLLTSPFLLALVVVKTLCLTLWLQKDPD